MRDAEELRYLVLALQRESTRMLAARLRRLDLTPAQAEALSVLSRYAPLSLMGLGELLVSESGTNPSRIVDRLATAGLVQRAVDPEDRRHVLLTLTTEGKQRARDVATVEDEVHDHLDELAAGRPTRPALGLLRAMVEGLPAGQALDRRRRAARP